MMKAKTQVIPIDTLIVEDHPVVAEGLIRILRNHPGLGQIYTAFDGTTCMRIMQNLAPKLILLDINLPDASGIDLCSKILEEWPESRVIAISSCNERAVIKKMIAAGAAGYLLKNASGEEIAGAVDEVLSGESFFSNEVGAILAVPASAENKPTLTRREREVLELISEGLTNSEIGEKIFVSTLTVDTHRKNLLVKLGARNSAALIRIALQLGLLHNS